MRKFHLILLMLFCSMILVAQKRVGIGTSSPQQRLSIDSTLNLDQSNYNNGTGPSLIFGNISGEGIGSRRTPGNNIYGLDFYTNSQNRLRIYNGGNVSIGTTDSAEKLNVGGTISSGPVYGSDMVIDKLGTNAGNWTGNDPALLFGGGNSGELISSSRTGTKNFNGIDFWSAANVRMSIGNNGNIGIGSRNPIAKLQVIQQGNYTRSETQGNAIEIWDTLGTNDGVLYMGADNANQLSFIQSTFTGGFRPLLIQARGGNIALGNITNPSSKLEVDGAIRTTTDLLVQGNKGIIRNNSSTQLKQVVSNALVTPTITAQGTAAQAVAWSENFSGIPVAAYVANITAGAGGWAEVVMTISNVTSTGCTLYVYNPRPVTVNPSFTVNIVTIGPQ